MKITIHYEGHIFESKDDKTPAQEFAENLYDGLQRDGKFIMVLKDDGYLVLPKGAAERCVFVITY